MVTITVGMGSGSRWPSGKPLKSELRPDGRTAHTMEDGRTITVPDKPLYRLEYEARLAGDSFNVDVTLIGLSSEDGYVETWNHKMGQLRSYAFHKILNITNLEDGRTHTARQLCMQLGGEILN